MGLYVFCRQSVFEDHPALSSTFQNFSKRPTSLALITGEQYPTSRLSSNVERNVHTVQDVTEMGTIAYQMAQLAIQKYMDEESAAKAAAAVIQMEEVAAESVPVYSVEATTMPSNYFIKPTQTSFQGEVDSESDDDK